MALIDQDRQQRSDEADVVTHAMLQVDADNNLFAVVSLILNSRIALMYLFQ